MAKDESTTTWIIQEWVPPENAIGKRQTLLCRERRGFWTGLADGWFEDYDRAVEALGRLKRAHRNVRLIEETREVVG